MLTLFTQVNQTEGDKASEQINSTIYAENTQTTDVRQETMQNTWLKPESIFKIVERTPEAGPKVVVQTLEAQEIDRPALTDGEILDYLQSKFLSHTAEALSIINCENSNADLMVVSKTGDVGLFQINLSAHWSEITGETREEKIEWLQNPLNNIDFARTLFNRNHWGDWYMSEDCWRPKFNNL